MPRAQDASGGVESYADRTGMSPQILRALAAHPAETAELVAGLSPRVTDWVGLLRLMHVAATEAVRLLPDAQWAGVTVQFDSVPFTAAHTADRVLIVEEHQHRRSGGPCPESLDTGCAVRMTVTEMRGRWPWLAAAADSVGVRTFFVAPILARGVPTATLNLYGGHDRPLDADPDVITVLSEYLSRGVEDYCTTQPDVAQGLRLRQAVRGRAVVDLACGVLMARHDLDRLEALELLTGQARRRGLPRWRHAEDVVARPSGDHSAR